MPSESAEQRQKDEGRQRVTHRLATTGTCPTVQDPDEPEPRPVHIRSTEWGQAWPVDAVQGYLDATPNLQCRVESQAPCLIDYHCQISRMDTLQPTGCSVSTCIHEDVVAVSPAQPSEPSELSKVRPNAFA
jgi:hypothetical protein